MSRKKRTSRILEKAELRSAGIKAIEPSVNFDDTYNLQNLTQTIEQLRAKIDSYNTALSIIDSSKTEIEEMEKTLSNLCERILIGVAFKYGKDSREYVMAGGVRKSDRVRKSTISRLKTGAEEAAENAKTA